MIKRMAFHWYVGRQLASLLPYRKKGLMFGPQVCEWAAVRPMIKSGFFVGCALSLADSAVAETALASSATKGDWRRAYANTIQAIEHRVQRKATLHMRFEDLISDSTEKKRQDTLLTPHECTGAIGRKVLAGLIFGLLSPDKASSMLEEWTSKKRGWKDLGVGGLRVDTSPQFANVQEACQGARAIYETWQTVMEKRPSLVGEQDNQPVQNQMKGQWLDSFMAIYREASPLINRVAKLSTEGQPADLYSLVEAHWSLDPLLQSSKRMPKPPQKELRNIKNDFEKMLSMCIKAGEMAMKMVDDLKHGARLASQMHFSSVVQYVGYAEIYRKALVKRLTKIGV